ncbi:hypothetical protein CRM22_010579 [Opisthorchis felineus]|uniref:Peptidase A1 domain-containing protein n=1 Tax=Opisthorchis felineus TaxID=147828 RepID=A0A4S2L2K9_OPIFE|nr:hypothetical protein CRM22_010579 [Opisthorchis felineus]
MIVTNFILLLLYRSCLRVHALPTRNETFNNAGEMKLERQRRDAHSHMLRVHPDGYLYMDLEIGRPQQQLRFEVDTSFGTSLIIAIPSSRGMNFVYYDAEASLSKDMGGQSCTYLASEQLNGRKNADVLRIGEYDFMNFHFQMIESLRWRPAFLDGCSGKLGLAPFSIVTQENFAQSLLRFFPNEASFTLWFRPDEDGVYTTGVFSFGGIHEYRYEWPPVYFPLMSTGASWIIQATKISLGQDVICWQDCNILFNTGVPYFYGPQQQIENAHRLLGVDISQMSGGAYLLDCKNANTYPMLSVEFGMFHAHWTMSELWEKGRDRRGHICKSGMRTSALVPGWAFGHKLMFKLFTVFDLGGARMGLAKASRP